MITVDVVVNDRVRMPKYHTAGAAGIDLVADIPRQLVIIPGEIVKVPTGVSVAIPEGFEGQMRPRSGLAAKGVWCHFGTIDSDYRGELVAVLANIGNEPQCIQPGDRIAQIVFAPVERAALLKAKELSVTVRGTGGFGSTGR
jgi:dUTP pyrophosphatase